MKIPVKNLPMTVSKELHDEWLAHPLTQLMLASIQLQQVFDKEQLSEVALQTFLTQSADMTGLIVRRDYGYGLQESIENLESMQEKLKIVLDYAGVEVND